MTTTPAELALVADELPVAIWMGRVPGGEVVYTNRAFREILGIEPPEGAARGAFVEPYGVHTLAGEPYPEADMPYERAVRARTTIVVEDLVIHRRDGRRVNLRVFAKPLFDADGQLTHVLEAFTDITREVEADRARIEGDRRLARAQRLESLGQLVAGIAHDFNNLLTVTKLGVSWLRSNDDPEGRNAALAQIDAVTDSAIQLIRNLLGFARRERHMTAPVLLEDVVGPVMAMASRTVDRGITLRTDCEPTPLVVLGDVSQLEQVLMNLVLNARDAIAGTGEIVVRTRARTVREGEHSALSAGEHAVLEVIDTGSGVDPGLRDRIFEPYFTTKTQGAVKGTGLGLATVHGIVKAHGGIVEVDDNVPRGAVLRVILPRVTEPTSRVPRSGPRADDDTWTRPDGKGRLLLVVDDEPLVRRSTVKTLRLFGYRVCEAEDGESALRVFGEHRGEIAGVILDMVMPGMRGRDVFLALRQRAPDVRVLLVSGCDLDADVKGLLQLGGGGWLPKPFDQAQLAAGLKTIGAL